MKFPWQKGKKEEKIVENKKILRNVTAKGYTDKKESYAIEEAYSYSSGDYVTPLSNPITISEVSELYERSNLLKKYIRVMLDELLRYDLIARPLEDKKDTAIAIKKAKEVNDLLKMSNKLETFREVREKYLKDFLLYGVGALEIEPSEGNRVDTLYAAAGYAVRLNVDHTGCNFEDENKAYAIMNPEDLEGEPVAYLPYNSLVYLSLDKISDRTYGMSPVASIYEELITDLTSAKNLQSGSNSMKSGVICLEKAPRKLVIDLMQRINLMLKRNARVRVACTNYKGSFLDLSNLTPEGTIKLQEWLIKKANIFGIPPYKLGISMESSMATRELKEDFRAAIENIVKYEIDKLNAILIKEKLKYDNHIEITCPSFATKLDYERARIAVRLLHGGAITPNEAREKYLGMNRVENDPEADNLRKPNIRETSEERNNDD